MHDRSVHQVKCKTDTSQILRDGTRQYPPPLRCVRIRASEEQQEDGGADVRVEFIFTRHPCGDETVEEDVAWCIVARAVDGIGEEVEGEKEGE